MAREDQMALLRLFLPNSCKDPELFLQPSARRRLIAWDAPSTGREGSISGGFDLVLRISNPPQNVLTISRKICNIDSMLAAVQS